LIAVDTNVLVAAHRSDAPGHAAAAAWLRHLADGALPWAVPVFCLAECLRVVTHPRAFRPASTLDQALAFLDAVQASPTFRLLVPGDRFAALFRSALADARATGNLVFDAQIVAVCLENGVSDVLSADRDFARFARIRRIDPSRPPG
jgi:toxin-antitoxin system PIN domain toxin